MRTSGHAIGLWSFGGFPPWGPSATAWSRGNATAYSIDVDGLFRRLKGFRRVFSRFDKLDIRFLAFLHFALIVEALR